jgi:hypothetical protein
VRAREAFQRFFAAEFPEARIAWARSIWSLDGSADTVCSLSFRNDLAYRIGQTHVQHADEIANNGASDDCPKTNRTRSRTA